METLKRSFKDFEGDTDASLWSEQTQDSAQLQSCDMYSFMKILSSETMNKRGCGGPFIRNSVWRGEGHTYGHLGYNWGDKWS